LTPSTPALRHAHRLAALALAGFLALHIGTHLTLLAGIEAHRTTLLALRPLTRALPFQALLLGLFALQIALGLALLYRRRPGRPPGHRLRRGWAAAQAASGLYLAAFLAQHVPTILIARAAQPPIDTDTHFAAAVLQGWSAAYFAPYSALAVAALATHLAAALRHRLPHAAILPAIGLALGCLIVAGLMGAFG
jgi:succinate dehydrogenase/fumarate reductase cytochrome b subunit